MRSATRASRTAERLSRAKGFRWGVPRPAAAAAAAATVAATMMRQARRAAASSTASGSEGEGRWDLSALRKPPGAVKGTRPAARPSASYGPVRAGAGSCSPLATAARAGRTSLFRCSSIRSRYSFSCFDSMSTAYTGAARTKASAWAWLRPYSSSVAATTRADDRSDSPTPSGNGSCLSRNDARAADTDMGSRRCAERSSSAEANVGILTRPGLLRLL
mmetsp:Transcript_5187/g.15409  ORF Transcript_5187/g.15409 Transcript_5187/m.15409 type:complete len:218 (-) Transcript_5187:207-860(-)